MMKNQSLHDALSLMSAHLETTFEKGAGKIKNPEELKTKYNLSVPQEGRSREELLSDMQAYLSETTNTLSPKFQNQLFSGIQPYALAGDWLSSLTNTTMATYEVSPMATVLERELINHMIKKVGWITGDGIMVTGGSNANLVGMILARNNLYPESKIEGAPSGLVIFVSEEAHYSFDKASNITGLGSANVRKVPSDRFGRMKTDALRDMIKLSLKKGEKPFFVAATAGTTVLGAYDPLDEISQICKENKLWFHVDGAWGASVLVSQKHRSLMKGIEKADSLAWDTHKMMGTGVISSFFLTNQKDSLRKSHDGGGNNYIFHESDSASWDSGPSSLQCGRRNDALKVWLAWRSLGDAGFEKIIDLHFENATIARNLISQNSLLELLYEPEMLNICFVFKAMKNSNQIQKEIRKRLLAEGQFYVNISTREDQTFFRLITTNSLLQKRHLEELFGRIIQIGQNLTKDNL